MTYYNNTNAPQQPQYQAKETSSFGGIVTQAPQSFDTRNGIGVNVNIVTNFKNKEGEIKPFYAQLTLFGSQAQFALDFLEVGDGVTGVGEKQWREYTDKNGEKQKQMQITVKSLNLPINKVADLIVRIVDSRVDAPDMVKEEVKEEKPQAPVQQGGVQPAPKVEDEAPNLDLLDDSVPF